MKKLAILLAQGFEDIEALVVSDFSTRAGIEVDLVSISDELIVETSHGVKIQANKKISQTRPQDYHAIYLPGGLPGAVNLKESKQVQDFLKEAMEADIIISALCASPMVFDAMGILTDGNYTCYPGVETGLKTKVDLDRSLIKDGKVWTGMGPMFAPKMAFALIETLLGEEKAEEIKEETLYNRLKEELRK